MSAPGDIRIGISGWRYAGWRGDFYPPGLAQRRELEFASRTFNSIELNGSFYSLQRPESFVRWYEETPPDQTTPVKYMKRFYDYRYAQSTLVPYRTVLTVDGKQTLETRILTVTYGVKMEDATFQSPDATSGME